MLAHRRWLFIHHPWLSGTFYRAYSQLSYEQAADATLEMIMDAFDLTLLAKAEALDATLSSGVLTLKCTPQKIILINKQPPNAQLWFSSPISGPRRFNWDPMHPIWGWKCNRNKETTLFALLNSDLSVLIGRPVDLFSGSSAQYIQ